MTFELSISQLVIIIGIIQGFILSLIIFFSTGKIAERFIALAVLAFTFNLTGFIFADSDIYYHNPDLLFLPFTQLLIIGPAFYLYFKEKTVKGIKTGDYLWFVPGIIEVFIQLILFIYSPDRKIEIVTGYAWLLYTAVENAVAVVYNIFFLLKSVLLLKNYKNNLLNKVSNSKHFKISEFNPLLICLSVLIVLWMFLYLSDLIFFDFKLSYGHYHPVYILTAIFIYWLGYKGLIWRKIALPEYIKIWNKDERPTGNIEILSRQIDSAAILRLEDFMNKKKPYLDSDMNLSTLASLLSIHQKNLSLIINHHYKRNFNDFINYHRIKEIKALLINPDNQKFTIISLAYDAGFSSKSSFNRIFKLHTGYTPKEYQEKHI